MEWISIRLWEMSHFFGLEMYVMDFAVRKLSHPEETRNSRLEKSHVHDPPGWIESFSETCTSTIINFHLVLFWDGWFRANLLDAPGGDGQVKDLCYLWPTDQPRQDHLEHIRSLPLVTPPGVFGFHENANLTKETSDWACYGSQRYMCWGKEPLQWHQGKRYKDMKWLFYSNQKTDLKSFFSLRSVFPPSPCFWQGDGYHQGIPRWC